MQWLDIEKSLRMRDGYFPKLEEKFPEAVEGMDNAIKDYHSAFSKLQAATLEDATHTESLNKIKAELVKITEAKAKLEEVADLTKEGWVGKKGKTPTIVKSTLDKYKAAHAKLENVIGAEKDGDPDVIKSFRNAVTELKATTTKAHGLMGNPFGMARMNGWSNIGDTVEHNLKSMRIWDDAHKLTAKTAPAVIFRGGALVGAGAAITDSVIRSRTNDGEDRSFVSRVMEAAGGAGLASAALLAGRAL